MLEGSDRKSDCKMCMNGWLTENNKLHRSCTDWAMRIHETIDDAISFIALLLKGQGKFVPILSIPLTV